MEEVVGSIPIGSTHRTGVIARAHVRSRPSVVTPTVGRTRREARMGEQSDATTADRDAAARTRLGAWMVIAGTSGTVLALLTYVDVWQVSDSRPTAWAVVAAACAVLTLAGAAMLWSGITRRARSAAGGGTRSD